MNVDQYKLYGGILAQNHLKSSEIDAKIIMIKSQIN